MSIMPTDDAGSPGSPQVPQRNVGEEAVREADGRPEEHSTCMFELQHQSRRAGSDALDRRRILRGTSNSTTVKEDTKMGVILGAGVTGLAAAIKTGYPVFEASDHPGGICRSYNLGGFEFSVGGGHWLFGEGPGLEFIKERVKLNEYERRAGIYYNTTFPYPFQTVAQGPVGPAGNRGILKHWLLDTFGQEQCNLFFFPFNSKYTAGLYEKVVQTDAFKSPQAGGQGFCPRFYSPDRGMTALIDNMALKAQISYKEQACRVDVKGKMVFFTSGLYLKYDRLISTIPLDNMLKLCGVGHNLPYTSVLCINIGAEMGKCTPTDHWLYIPFCKGGFYRVGFYSNVNACYAPGGCVGLSVEMAFLPDKRPDPIELERIVFNVIDELQGWNWIGKVRVVDPTYVSTAYTWLYGKDDAAEKIAWLKEHDIYSVGRYGGWKFTGIAGSIEQGLSV